MNLCTYFISITESSKNAEKNPIDDLFLTEFFLKAYKENINIYDWSDNFLEEFPREKGEVLNKKLFSPQILAGNNLKIDEMKMLSKKFEKCNRKLCFSKIYENQDLREVVRPKKIDQLIRNDFQRKITKDEL